MHPNQNLFVVSLLIGRSKTGKQTDVARALRTKPGLPLVRKRSGENIALLEVRGNSGNLSLR